MSKKTPALTPMERLNKLAEGILEQAEIEVDIAKKGTATRTATQVFAELRKAESAEHKRTSMLTKALVTEWFRQLDPSDRASFVRELQQIDSKRSSLA